MNLIEALAQALKRGGKIKRKEWADWFHPESRNYSIKDLSQIDWEVEPIKLKSVKRWKCYFLHETGGLEVAWLTEEEKFRIPDSDKDVYVTEEIGEFPL